jgi:hypothetical protein
LLRGECHNGNEKFFRDYNHQQTSTTLSIPFITSTTWAVTSGGHLHEKLTEQVNDRSQVKCRIQSFNQFTSKNLTESVHIRRNCSINWHPKKSFNSLISDEIIQWVHISSHHMKSVNIFNYFDSFLLDEITELIQSIHIRRHHLVISASSISSHQMTFCWQFTAD